MKDSGIEWIGDIPNDWKVNRIKDEVLIDSEYITEKTNPDTEIKYVEITSVESTGLIREPESLLFKNAPSRARRIIKNGDTIISTVRPYLQSIAFFKKAEPNLIVSTGFATLSPKMGLEPKFVYYYAFSHFFLCYMVSRSVGVSYPAVNQKELDTIPFLKPSIQEQQIIVSYLDFEISKIQQLVEIKKRQIEFLLEYEKSLIHNAITKGLDTNAKMKDSGVDWIGDTPSDWKLLRIKSVCDLVGGGTPKTNNPEYWEGGTIPWAIPTDFQNSPGMEINSTEEKITEKGLKESSATLIPAGSVIMCSRASIGDCKINKVPISTNQGFCSFICKGVQNKYLSYMIISGLNQELQKRATKSTFAEISRGKISQIKIPVPERPEQEKISAFLDLETSKLHQVRNNLELEIAQLEEYEKSVIYGIMTGKLMVS